MGHADPQHRDQSRVSDTTLVGGTRAASTLTLSQRLSRFAAGFAPALIPERTRERAKLLLLDATGIALASGRQDFAHRILSGLASISEGRSSLIGLPARLSLRDAVIMNGALVHGLDYDDTHVRAIIHATASTFPCALSLAESVDASGADFLAAYILGMEIAIRISDAAGGRFHDLGFHPTGLAAPFACAIQAGWFWGLSEEQLVMAQGLGCSTAAGSQEFLEEGAWNKRIHPGWGAAAGITAAALARGGFKGPSRTYEGRYGLFRNYLGSHADQVDPEALLRGLGEVWEIHEVAIKPYPICHLIHACADAALLLREQHSIRPEDIESITALLPQPTLHIVAEPASIKMRPANEYDAKFSTHYVLATCMVRGRFGLPELRQDALHDTAVLALAQRVRCVVDPDARYPKYFSGGVEITLRDGRRFRHHEPINRGAGERALSAAEIEHKFFDNALTAVSRPRAERIRDALFEVERAPVQSLIEALRA